MMEGSRNMSRNYNNTTERELADTTNTLMKNSKELWKTFLNTFDWDWTDTLNKEKAYQQLINLRMQPGQLDEYILTFK